MNEPSASASASKNEEKDEEVDLCPICSLPSISSCRNCKKISYCSKPHQRAHWKEHKADCFPLIHQYDPILGSRLLTTRSVKAGEVIWREKSLLCGPRHLAKQCLVCLAVKSNYNSYSYCPCPACGLLLCDKESCNKIHVGSAECKIFTQNKPKSSKELFIARALLLIKEEPSVWRKLVEMDEKLGEHNFSAEYFMSLNLFNGSDQEVHIVSRLLRAKVFETRNSRQLYFTAGQGGQSCVPNCSWIIQEEEEEHQAFEIQLRANIPIQFGRTVSICKGDASLGLSNRREFCGECERCKSPNELDTGYSGIKCPNCENYCVMRPVFEKKVRWSCAECGIVKDWQFYEQLVEEIKKELSSLLCSEENSNVIIAKLKEAGRKFSERKVHPNHFVIFGIELEILKRISQHLRENKDRVESEEEWVGFVETFVALGRKWLEVGDVLWPGLTGQRGELLYYYQQALTYQSLLTISQNMRCSDSDLDIETKDLASIRQSQLETQFHKIISIRRLILQIFCYHPKSSVEGKFAEEMAQIYCPEIEVLKYYVFLGKNKQSVL